MDPSDKFDIRDYFGSDVDVYGIPLESSSGNTGDPVSEAGTDENQHVGQPGQTVPVPGEADPSHNQATNTGPMMHSPVLQNSDSDSGYMPPNHPSTASHSPLDSTSTSAANSRDHLHEAPPLASASATSVSATSVSAPTATGSQPTTTNSPGTHTIDHTIERSGSFFICRPCGFTTLDEWQCERHCNTRKHQKNTSTGDNNTGVERFHCPYPSCKYAENNLNGKNFTHKDHLTNHIYHIHGSEMDG